MNLPSPLIPADGLVIYQRDDADRTQKIDKNWAANLRSFVLLVLLIRSIDSGVFLWACPIRLKFSIPPPRCHIHGAAGHWAELGQRIDPIHAKEGSKCARLPSSIKRAAAGRRPRRSTLRPVSHASVIKPCWSTSI